MIKENQKFLNFINIFLDGALIPISIYLAFNLRFSLVDGYPLVPLKNYLLLSLVDIPIQLLLFYLFHLYEPQRKRRLHDELAKMITATTISFGLIFCYLYITKDVDYSRLALLGFYIIKNMLLGGKRICLRLLLRKMRSSGFNQKHIILVGSNVMIRNCYKEIRRSPELGYVVHGYVADEDNWDDLPWLGGFEELNSILASLNPDEIIVSLDGEQNRHLENIIFFCENNGVRFSYIPYFSQFMSARTQADSLNGIPILNLRKIPLDYIGNAMLKRTMDIICSALLILITSPVMLVIAIGVKLSSPGPVIFRQERVGYGKKPFYMYKFRSMRVNTEQNTGWTTDSDPRKTKFGAFIRKYSLDELPQFFNVLKGDMSLVGPRPEIPYFVEQFRDEIPHYLLRQQVRPGITVWAQINGLRGDTSISERVRYDRWYIQHWSLGLDLVILLRTVFGGFMNSEVISPPEEESRKEESQETANV